MEKLFNIADLLESEVETSAKTSALIVAFDSRYPTHLEALLHASYYRGENPDPATEDGLFFFFASTQYFQLPYSFRAVFDLAKRGYYFEASVLVRSLIEVLVQLQYFHRYRGQLEPHLLDTARIRFRTMFEELAPGYYKSQYGDVFSNFAHGKTGQLCFRYDHTDPGNRRVIHGSEFSEKHIAFVVNHLTFLLYAFIKNFAKFFPSNTLAENASVEVELEKSLGWLREGLAAHEAQFPESSSWHELIDGLGS